MKKYFLLAVLSSLSLFSGAVFAEATGCLTVVNYAPYAVTINSVTPAYMSSNGNASNLNGVSLFQNNVPGASSSPMVFIQTVKSGTSSLIFNFTVSAPGFPQGSIAMYMNNPSTISGANSAGNLLSYTLLNSNTNTNCPDNTGTMQQGGYNYVLKICSVNDPNCSSSTALKK